MLTILRGMWRALVAIADFLRKLISVLMVLVLVIVLVTVLRGGDGIQVEDNVALVVAPSGWIVEYDDTDPRERVLDELLGEPPAVMEIGDITTAIEAAAEDARIGLLFLKLDEGFSAGQAQLEEIANAIEVFRASGKPVHAWAPFLGQSEYFLAAHADRIAIDPMGAVFLPGFEAENLYFAQALESLGVEVHVFRAGEYKSAVEPFIRNDMSEAARSNARRWLDSLWGNWKSRVAERRGQSPEALQTYADAFVEHLAQSEGDTARVALDQGLATATETLAQVREAAAEIVGRDPDHGSFRQIWQGQYLSAIRRNGWPGSRLPSMAESAPAEPKVIALVHVQGEIVDGEGVPGQAGGSLIRSLIEDATRDETVAALVLRVDSPGGSVSASEEIRQAVRAFQQSGRPVVASMGSVAASGGYWVSMDADRIVASASSITGSIGVFGLVPTIEQGLGKLGIHADGTGTTIWSGSLNPARPLSEAARKALDLIVAHDYRQFTQHVADARQMELEAVEAVASGQVWTGAQAQELGLVDLLGDYALAISQAQELAGLPEEAEVQLFAPEPDIRIQLLERFSSRMQAQWPGAALWKQAEGALRPLLQPSQRGTLAHCLCDPRAGRGR